MKSAWWFVTAAFLTGLLHAGEPPHKWSDSREIWFKHSAPEWRLGSPVGNGRIGAMIAGDWPKENIQLNEDTIWAKEPMRRHPATTKDLIDKVQDLVEAGKYAQAHDVYLNEIIMSRAPKIGSYQTMGDLWIEFIGDLQPKKEGYRRSLDIATGLVTIVRRMSDGSIITQETVCSAVDDCLAIRLSTTGKEGLDLDIRMRHPLPTVSAVSKGTDMLRFDGQAGYDREVDPYLGTQFSTLLKAITEDGSVVSEGGVLKIRNASSLTLLLTCATDYNAANPQEPLPDGWQRKAVTTLAAAEIKPWKHIKKDSMDDVASFMHRCDIDLGTSSAALLSLPNDERMARFKGTASDPDFIEMYFHFARYLLVSSSRPGTRPANLQGIWANLLQNPWESDYHLNINMQMNYWHVHTTGLSELHQPVFWMLDMLREEGRKMAASFGAKGFCTPHALNLWGRTLLNDREPRWSGSLISAPWMTMDVMEHYRFTGDLEFLRESGWPILKESCEFLRSWIIRDPQTGKWVGRASCSHEIGFYYEDENDVEQFSEIGPVTAYDLSIIWQIFSDYLEAADLLGIDDSFTHDIRKTLPELEYPRIGKDGEILEWGIENTREADPKHRHLGHLLGLHPGTQITKRKTPELYDAAKQSLVKRGMQGAGWAMVHRSLQYARHGDGDTALKALDQVASRPSPSFMGDERCQLDQVFGLASAVVEMLLQSHDGAVELLPALPTSWKDGSAHGLLARGGFEISEMEWHDGLLTRVSIVSRRGGPLLIRYRGSMQTFDTQKGQEIEFTP